MRDADAGEEQAQEIVGLGDRADRGAGIGRDRLLVDGDGRGDALDGFDLGLFHHLHILAGIGGHAFDVAALALGEKGVEGQGGLARSARTGDDDEAVPRQAHVNALQIVLGRLLDDNIGQHNSLF